MGSNATNKSQLLWGKAIEQEGDFYGKYAYTGAFVFRTTPIDSTTSQEVHFIIAGSQYFVGSSEYDLAPTGSLGVSKAGGSTTLNVCVSAVGSGGWAVALLGTAG